MSTMKYLVAAVVLVASTFAAPQSYASYGYRYQTPYYVATNNQAAQSNMATPILTYNQPGVEILRPTYNPNPPAQLPLFNFNGQKAEILPSPCNHHAASVIQREQHPFTSINENTDKTLVASSTQSQAATNKSPINIDFNENMIRNVLAKIMNETKANITTMNSQINESSINGQSQNFDNGATISTSVEIEKTRAKYLTEKNEDNVEVKEYSVPANRISIESSVSDATNENESSTETVITDETQTFVNKEEATTIPSEETHSTTQVPMASIDVYGNGVQTGELTKLNNQLETTSQNHHNVHTNSGVTGTNSVISTMTTGMNQENTDKSAINSAANQAQQIDTIKAAEAQLSALIQAYQRTLVALQQTNAQSSSSTKQSTSTTTGIHTASWATIGSNGQVQPTDAVKKATEEHLALVEAAYAKINQRPNPSANNQMTWAMSVNALAEQNEAIRKATEAHLEQVNEAYARVNKQFGLQVPCAHQRSAAGLSTVYEGPMAQLDAYGNVMQTDEVQRATAAHLATVDAAYKKAPSPAKSESTNQQTWATLGANGQVQATEDVQKAADNQLAILNAAYAAVNARPMTYSGPLATLDANGNVMETDEVKRAKEAHLNAHAVISGLNHSAGTWSGPSAPLGPDGNVIDTDEVTALKRIHQQFHDLHTAATVNHQHSSTSHQSSSSSHATSSVGSTIALNGSPIPTVEATLVA